jgi:hypothetical protein
MQDGVDGGKGGGGRGGGGGGMGGWSSRFTSPWKIGSKQQASTPQKVQTLNPKP